VEHLVKVLPNEEVKVVDPRAKGVVVLVVLAKETNHKQCTLKKVLRKLQLNMIMSIRRLRRKSSNRLNKKVNKSSQVI
jgi:hypothetical protein